MGKILGIFIFLKARLKEPSTHASLAAVFAMLGTTFDAGAVDDWLNTLTLVFGALGFFVEESKPLSRL
jgi:hypothetical protein